MNASALLLSLGLAVFAALLCWALSLVFRAHAWVDRLWAVVPLLYVGGFAMASFGSHSRLNLMAAVAGAWGLWLILRPARQGGDAPGAEDGRWTTLRPRTRLPFNAAVLSGIVGACQYLALWMVAVPAWTVYQGPGALHGGDLGLALLLLLVFSASYVTDLQLRAVDRIQRRLAANRGATRESGG